MNYFNVVRPTQEQPDKSRQVWERKGMPGHTQPTVVVLDTIFLWYLSSTKKYVSHCCNLIRREHISVNKLKFGVSVVEKNTFVS